LDGNCHSYVLQQALNSSIGHFQSSSSFQIFAQSGTKGHSTLNGTMPYGILGHMLVWARLGLFYNPN